MESYRLDEWEAALGSIRFIQENESFSTQSVLRGLHYQIPPHGQSKLIRVVCGAIKDVVVDMRPESPTFGRYYMEILDEINKKQLFVPSGFAHGFLTLSPQAVVLYKVDAPYHPAAERTLCFNDETLKIEWGGPSDSFILSDKDRNGLSWTAAIVDRLNP